VLAYYLALLVSLGFLAFVRALSNALPNLIFGARL